MKSFSNSNRKNGRILAMLTAIATAATLTAVCAQPASANTDSWVGATANWNVATDWSEGYLPGSQSQTGYTYPAGPWDDVVINNGGSVTINTNENSGYPSGLNLRDFNLNDGGESGHVGYTAGSSLTVATGGYLSFTPNQINGGSGAGVANGYDATINITGGELLGFGGTTLGDGIGWAGGVQNQVGTGTLNVSAGLFGTSGSVDSGATSSGLTVGNQSNGVVNLSGTGTINTGEYGAISLGAGTPASGFSSYGTGIFTQTGGTLDNGRNFIIGGNATGEYNLSAGTAVVGTNNGTFMIGQNASGTFTMTGGTLTSNNTMQVGGGTGAGTATISGGSLALPNLLVGNSNATGTGKLVISGSGSTGINISVNAGGSPMTSYSNGTLDFQIGSGGVTPITAVSTATGDGRCLINLSGTLELDLLGGFTPTHGQTFALVTTNVTAGDSNGNFGIITANETYNNGFGSVTNAGLNLDPTDAANWSWAVDPIVSGGNTTGYELVATYIGQPTIPEPATLGLMAVAGAGLLLIGRRRKPA